MRNGQHACAPRKESRRGLLALASSLLVGLMAIGCAKPTRVPLKEDLRASINSTKTVAGFTQQEIGTSIQSAQGASAGQFGLIGALVESGIDNSRTKAAEGAVGPVRNALLGYDPGKALGEALKKELTPVVWLKSGAVEVQSMGDVTVMTTWLDKCESNVLLVVRPEYRLTPKFDGVMVTAKVSLHPKTSPLAEAKHPYGTLPGVIYSNEFTTTYTLSDWPSPAPKELADAAKLWTLDNASKGRALLDSAMAEIAQMIAWDLEQPGSLEQRYSAPEGAKKITINWQGFGLHDVPVVHEGNGRVWGRHSWGQLYSIKQP